MKHWICPLVFVAMAPASAYAVICKTVDADGVVTYSEVPAAQCPEKVDLPDYSRYAPRPLPQTIRDESPQEAAADESFAGYSEIAIVVPEQDGTVRDNQGKVMVNIALEPTLQDGHQVRLFIDGQAVPGSFDGTTIELSGVERGTHQLLAEVIDANGSSMLRSDSVSFTMRQVGLFDGAGGPPPGAPPGIRPPSR
jgi:hypothetical protein